ncbi:MAG: peptidoglycan-binding domain-containing protein [Rhodospirillaceae bacterium]|nr:peptidoglycan-binding domain-containing protein [Rhodospirillaceae bacterium]
MSGRIFAVLLLALATTVAAPPASARDYDAEMRRLIVEVAREMNGKHFRGISYSSYRLRGTYSLEGERVIWRTHVVNGGATGVVAFSLSDIREVTFDGTLLHFHCHGNRKCVNATAKGPRGPKRFSGVSANTALQTGGLYRTFNTNADVNRIMALVRKFQALKNAKSGNRQTARGQSGRQPGRQAADPPRAPRSSAAATAEAALLLSRNQRKAVQQALNALGHNAGVPDGIFGSRTRAAIRALQKALGQQPTGYLTDLLLSKLREKMRSARTETAGSIPRAGSCIRHQDVGQCASHWRTCVGREDDGSGDSYQLNVRFTNNCPHEVFLIVRHLSGLKYEVDRGAPITCTSGGATDIKPGESYMWKMGPLPRGVTQKWEGCVQYSNEDIQKRSGERNCYQRRRPKCPAGYQ